MEKQKTQNDVISLNDKLFNEFTIDELEKRLETDPLLLISLFTGIVATSGGDETMGCDCNRITSCPELKCGCRATASMF